jgi:transposase
MPVAKIAEVTFTSTDRVRDVLHNFNTDGFDSLYPRYAGGRPPKFDLKQRAAIKQIALSRPADHDLPFSVWSLSKLADFLVAEGVVDDISHEGLRLLLRDEDVSFQALKTFKASTDPDYETKTNRVLALSAIADGMVAPGPDDPTIVFCVDEFGPLNLQPHPGKQWAPRASGRGDPAAPRRRRRRATYTRPHGVRHLFAALDLARDKLYGHVTAARAAPNSWPSAAICARSTRPTCASRSSATTSAPICRPAAMTGSWHGRRRTTSRSPTRRSTAPGSTASSRSSPPCATSPSTAPITPPTMSKHA